MPLLVLLLMVVGLLWLAARAGFRLSDQALSVLVRGFVAWRGGKLDQWPRGVQEEDRDSRWGRPSEPPPDATPVRAPLTRVEPAIHAR